MRARSFNPVVCLVVVGSIVSCACSTSSSGDNGGNSSGGGAAGGVTAVGGTGGTSMTSGGVTGTGGGITTTGGLPSGGITWAGGSPTGGLTAAGGFNPTTGGTTGSGGAPITGGTPGSSGATVSGGATSFGGSTELGGSTGSGGRSVGGRGGTGGDGRSGSGGATETGGTTGTGGGGGSSQLGDGPCDIYAAANKPCVAAYSMVRVLRKAYAGPLYQVRKGGGSKNTGTGGTVSDIKATTDGYGDSATQDAFCGSDSCTVSILYDQSGQGNDLKVAPAGCYDDGSANTPDYESSAKERSLTVNGHRVYALYMNAHEGYRDNQTTGMTKTADQSVYVLADGKHFGEACCWDFGNASTDNCNRGVMNTVFFGRGFWGMGAGDPPWFMGDFEGGVWAGGSGDSKTQNPNNPSMGVDFAFGIVKSSSGKYAIRVGNGQSGGLTTAYDGNSPKQLSAPGGIVLGIGGDNSNHSWGTFFEGAIVASRPDDATDAAILQNIQAFGYTK